jgi:hypothetical protein
MLKDHISIGRKIAEAIPISTSAAVVGAYATSYEIPIDEQQQGWFEPLISGAYLATGSPVLALREFFIRRGKNIARGRRDILDQRRHLGVYLKAWELWRDKKTSLLLREPPSVPRIGLARVPPGTSGRDEANDEGKTLCPRRSVA